MAGKRVENCIYDLGEDRAKRYFVRVKLPNRKEVTGAFVGIKAARAFRDTKASNRAQGLTVAPRSSSITFKEFAEDWRTNRMRLQRLSTATKVEAYFRNHVYPAIGQHKIGAIRRSHVEALVAEMTDDLEAVTVRIIYSYVAGVFAAAIDDDVIPKTPCIKISLPVSETDDEKVVPLASETVKHIAEAMVDPWSFAVILGAATGLRPGELFGLTLDKVDFFGKTITVDRQLITPQKGSMYLGPLKTKASRRSIPVPDRVVKMLAAHLQLHPPTAYTIPLGAPPLGDGEDKRKRVEAQFLFMLNGAPGRRARQSAEWRRAIDDLDLPDRSGWHALRHYYASVLIAANMSVKVIQERLGHKSAMETLDTYGHLWPVDDDRTRRIVGEALDGICGEGDEGGGLAAVRG